MEENKNINEINKLAVDLTDQDDIVNKLKAEKNNTIIYKNLLTYYYQILSPEKCKIFDINKTKTEKKLFYEIISNLIKIFYKNDNENKGKEIRKKIENEIIDYVIELLKSPAIEELKNLELVKIPSRWNIIYRRLIKFEEEKNEELIYYNFSNNFLHNIINCKNPYDIIILLNQFKAVIGDFENIDKLSIIQKKFILFGLCNTEYKGPDFDIRTYIAQLKNLILINSKNENEFNNQNIFNGLLNEVIVNYCSSKLAKDAFNNLFGELPEEMKKEIFSEKILNYIYYIPFTAAENIERTDKRFSLILINQLEDSKIIQIKIPILNELLTNFVNIVVRKFEFQHEHQHFSGGLLFIIGKEKCINTPRQNYENNKLTILPDHYEIKKLEEKSIVESEERGELYEQMYYGKILSEFKMIELLFIADENNYNLEKEEHLNKFNKFTKEITLEEALKNYPKNQNLSELVSRIYSELLADKEENGDKSYLVILEGKAVAKKKGKKHDNEKSITTLNNNIIAEKGKCYLSSKKT